MAGIFGVFRNVVFLGWLSVALVSTTIATGIWALQMTTTVAAMSAKAAATAVAHRKQLAKAVAKTNRLFTTRFSSVHNVEQTSDTSHPAPLAQPA